MSTVNVPGFGAQDKQKVMIVGGVLAVVGGVVYYRHRAAAAATNAIDPNAATDTSAVDPATGLAYGSPEDAAALASQSAFVQPADFTSGQVASGSTGSTVVQYVSNAQWSQAAVDYLSTAASLSAAAVSQALGRYLSGETVTPTQHSYIEQAIASQGLPPVGGTNGYPPSIKSAPVSNPTTTTKAPATMKNGYFVRIPDGVHFMANGNKRFYVTPATYKRLAAAHTHFTSVLANSQLFKLPDGGQV